MPLIFVFIHTICLSYVTHTGQVFTQGVTIDHGITGPMGDRGEWGTLPGKAWAEPCAMAGSSHQVCRMVVVGQP